jgi:hypothetical protein
MAEALVHRMSRTLSVPEKGEPFWQTLCGVRLGGNAPNVTTAEDKKEVTCSKCKAKK